MIAIRPTDPKVVEDRWAKVREASRVLAHRVAPPSRPGNVRAVLDLGTLTYFTFRGRMYGVPPLPWRQGELLLDAWLELQGMGDQVTEKNVRRYYKILGELARIIWKNTRMVGHFPRMLKRLRLIKNPFDRANDKELADIAVFYLGRRMSETGGFQPGTAPPREI